MPVVCVPWHTPQNHLYFPGVVTLESGSLVRNYSAKDTLSSNEKQVTTNCDYGGPELHCIWIESVFPMSNMVTFSVIYNYFYKWRALSKTWWMQKNKIKKRPAILSCTDSITCTANMLCQSAVSGDSRPQTLHYVYIGAISNMSAPQNYWTWRSAAICHDTSLTCSLEMYDQAAHQKLMLLANGNLWIR